MKYFNNYGFVKYLNYRLLIDQRNKDLSFKTYSQLAD